MSGQGTLRSWERAAGCWSVLAACLVAQAAVAQTRTGYDVTSTLDAYGNARPYYRARRSVAFFSSEMQHEVLRGYQTRGRRVDRRGGFRPFALPGDVFARRRPRSTGSLATPLGRSLTVAVPTAATALSPQRRRALERYGGFGRRAPGAEAGDVLTAFERRYALIEATSLNAPVYRAVLRSGSGFGLRSSLAKTPFVQKEESRPATPSSSLEQRLREGAGIAYERARAEGWAWFREGRYHRAARVFETATLLQPSDGESRIGGLFCHLSLGAIRTALAVLGELNRRDQNPFAFALNLTDAYADASLAKEVRIASQLRAGVGSESPDLRALHAFVLWYLGEKDEAAVAAATLRRAFPGTDYADWPAKMRAAKAALAAQRRE